MVEYAVFFLVNKLIPYVEDEVRLLSGVSQDVNYVKVKLESMTAFLRVADAVEDDDEQFKVWTNQVRDLVYDTEDVLEEFMLRLGHQHGRGFYGYLRYISWSMLNLKCRHRIASKMQSIKSRVTDILDGYQGLLRRYNALEQRHLPSASTPRNAWNDPQGDALLVEATELVGIDERKEDLIGLLVNRDSTLKVVSVVGRGGLGKTTLVKQVYDDSEVKQHFDNHAWITVSQSSTLDDLLKDLIQQLFSEIRQTVPQELETANSQQLKNKIYIFLRQSKYLLVLDDVGSTEVWEAVKYALPRNNYGSRVMLTTRNADVAKLSSRDTRGSVYKMNQLSKDESWTLFCRKTFLEDSCPPLLEELSRRILARCGGLPLAIVAISGVLATKDKTRIEEWEMIYRSLGAELEDHKMLKNLKIILSSSYNDLPYNLKPCFLYLSIFPEYHLIETVRLIRLWIAEGFVNARQGKTLEEVAESYLNELLSRNLIQVAGTTSDGRLKKCNIHDLLREIIISKSRDQNLIAISTEQNMMCPEKVRCLSVHNTLQYLKRNKSACRLRSLLVFGEEDIVSKPMGPKLFSTSFKLIRVLDLQGAPLEMFPEEVFKLFQLKYLSLRETNVKTLPSSIGKLKNLHTLDLKHTLITKLPVEILKLQQLSHLLVYRYEMKSYAPFLYKQGFEAPFNIGGMQSLQKLCFIKANNNGTSGNTMGEIGRLHQLRRLGIIMMKREDGVALCSSLQKLSNLRALSVTTTEENEIIDLKYLPSPPPFLQRLYLAGRLKKLPNWIPLANSLVKLFLKWSQLTVDPLEALQDLPNLVHLEFLQVYNGETLCFKSKGFQKLKILGLDKMEGLKLLTVEKGAMPNLEKLIIQRCESMHKAPAGIEHLKNLKLLEFFDMPEELILTLRPQLEGEDYKNVEHIPQVYYTYWRDGVWETYALHRVREMDSFNRRHNCKSPSWMYK